MKIKTYELTNDALLYAVVKADGDLTEYEMRYYPLDTHSLNWTECGPIIEREKIALDFFEDLCGAGVHLDGELSHLSHGPTPLIAAMRCFCASKLGDEVDVPDELLT
jgi:hypothetical protein